MTKKQDKSLLSLLGWLRTGLFTAGLVIILFSAANWILFNSPGDGSFKTLWDILSGMVAPVLAPLILVVILFDWIMSRLRASDTEGEAGAELQRIARFEITLLALMALYWVPYFYVLVN